MIYDTLEVLSLFILRFYGLFTFISGENELHIKAGLLFALFYTFPLVVFIQVGEICICLITVIDLGDDSGITQGQELVIQTLSAYDIYIIGIDLFLYDELQKFFLAVYYLGILYGI